MLSYLRRQWSAYEGILPIVVFILVFTGILGMRHLGWLEAWELLAYDQMVRLRQEEGTDSRILIVSITEEDIRTQKQWPISDLALAQVLRKLQTFKPQSIGLDLYRDIPVEPGHQELLAELKQPNIFAVRNIDNVAGTPAPLALPPERVGFNNIALDQDGIVRRNILFTETSDGFLSSFSLLLALDYLEKQGIMPQASQENPDYLQLQTAVFIPLQPNSGAYENVDSQGYQILLDYRTPGNFARTITFSEVLSEKIESEWVKDKIVLIGSIAPSLKDYFFTPYSRQKTVNEIITLPWSTKQISVNVQYPQKMPGVLVQGQMLSQFLDAATGKRLLFWFWSEKLEKLWIFAWVGLGGILGWIFRHPILLIVSVSVGLAIIFISATIIFINYGWIPVATTILGFVVSLGMTVTYQSYQDHHKQQIVMKLLGQNTSPEIATALWNERDGLLTAGRLPGVLLVATLMFLDIKGFSSVSEVMSPKDLLAWLNELLEIIAHEVVAHKGIINKFTGDGAMAVFGVPIPRHTQAAIAQDVENCINCALAIGQHLDKINADDRQHSLPQIQLRIGIFTGPVVVGSLGGKDRIEYGVIGDTVNTAARLEACEKDRQPSDCRILLGKETLSYVQDQFVVEYWGPTELKGKKQIVEVYRVIGKKAVDT